MQPELTGAPLAPKQARSEAAARALVGLLVHSAADGFAVGASAVSPSSSLSFLVAVAMVLHKVRPAAKLRIYMLGHTNISTAWAAQAPVAFGLATYLLAARWPWARVRRALLLFAAASPVTAIVTYALILALPGLSTQASIALCVLFSGVTAVWRLCCTACSLPPFVI